jgi:zinc D-Ala-D-Ala carboxypeptidase
MNLTKNFTLEEMYKSTTAIRLGIDNTPSDIAIKNLLLLCQKVLQPLRENIGESIKVSSGYRSPALNKKIGGSKSSQHCLGQAADISCGERTAELYNYIKNNLIFDQIIWEFGTDKNPDWVHVSYSSTRNRKECLRAYKINGKTVYQSV